MSIEIYPTRKNIRLSKNFMLNEFRSKDGTATVIIDRRLIDLLQKMRDEVGRPITINSGYRSFEHNNSSRVKGAANSQHMYGTAADIVISGMTPKQVEALAKKHGAVFTQLYAGSNFTHVDVRNTMTTKNYN